MPKRCSAFTRRRVVQAASYAGVLAGLEGLFPAWARNGSSQGLPMSSSDGSDFALTIREQPLMIGARPATAKTINGTMPGPLLRFREGDSVTLRVRNELDEDTSIHWHGIMLPANMDGVPNVSFPGIPPGQSYVYEYTLRQSGTYWYHSHSGLQEQSGVFGPIIIDPAALEPISYHRDHIVMLSDWTFHDPDKAFAKLKKSSDYYNFQKRTLVDLLTDMSRNGLGATLEDRLAWARMRMDPTDIADISGHNFSYLINGKAPSSNWTCLFRPGERVRLRFINAAAMTYFNIRIPGLAMTVVQADGQDIEPVTVDEFQMAVAETYDVIVEPEEDRAYTIFAEAMDRSGFARGTLAPRFGMVAPVPDLRPRPALTMKDMGMGDQDMGAMSDQARHEKHMPMTGQATTGGASMTGRDLKGVGVDNVASRPMSRLDEPGTGLENVGHRALTYRDLRSLVPAYDQRPPARELALHLTGNMERYMWSFDGKTYSQAKEPIATRYGERLRLTMINDTMMNHPIHLHGMWMVLDNGAGDRAPRKHTVNLKPGEKLSVLVTADALGDWALHCHLLYHMKAGMFRVVSVSRDLAEVTP